MSSVTEQVDTLDGSELELLVHGGHGHPHAVLGRAHRTTAP